MRWLVVRRRQFSIRQASERRAAAQAAAGVVGSEGVTMSRTVMAQEETVDLAQFSSQTQRMLTTLLIVAALAGAWGI